MSFSPSCLLWGPHRKLSRIVCSLEDWSDTEHVSSCLHCSCISVLYLQLHSSFVLSLWFFHFLPPLHTFPSIKWGCGKKKRKEVCVHIAHHRSPGTEWPKEQREHVVQARARELPLCACLIHGVQGIHEAFWCWNRGRGGRIEWWKDVK